MTLSIVTTLHRSAAAIDESYPRTVKATEALNDDVELTMADDGLSDRSPERAPGMQREDRRPIDLRRSLRNPGRAVMVRLSYALGERVCLLDNDTEEVLEDLSRFHQRFLGGDCDVVYRLYQNQ